MASWKPVGHYVTNHAEIARRGGWVYGEDVDFVVVACKNCGQQFLYDEEALQLYSDPTDLSARYLYADGYEVPNCSRCGNEMDFKYLEADSSEVAEGPWSWTR